MKGIKYIPISLFIIMVSCDLPTDPGPMPVDIIHTEFEPEHNILGVLRLDDNPGSSFIRVEKAYKIEEITEGVSPVVNNADVTIIAEDTSAFTFVSDSTRGDIYTDSSFVPVEGVEYTLTVSSPDLPELTATTKIPSYPSIDESSLTITEQSVLLTILSSPSIDLYDVYLISEIDEIQVRIVNESENISISFDLSKLSGDPSTIEIYGYENNLSKYLQSSISIKPQSYHETVTTVSNGYGCFGAVSKTTIHL